MNKKIIICFGLILYLSVPLLADQKSAAEKEGNVQVGITMPNPEDKSIKRRRVEELSQSPSFMEMLRSQSLSNKETKESIERESGKIGSGEMSEISLKITKKLEKKKESELRDLINRRDNLKKGVKTKKNKEELKIIEQDIELINKEKKELFRLRKEVEEAQGDRSRDAANLKKQRKEIEKMILKDKKISKKEKEMMLKEMKDEFSKLKRGKERDRGRMSKDIIAEREERRQNKKEWEMDKKAIADQQWEDHQKALEEELDQAKKRGDKDLIKDLERRKKEPRPDK